MTDANAVNETGSVSTPDRETPPPTQARDYPGYQRAQHLPGPKSAVLAAILSFVPGLGQIYVGHYSRGFVHILVFAGTISFIVGMENSGGDVEAFLPLFGLFLPFFWLYNIIDAARRASLYNLALAGGVAPEIPDDFKFPSMGGSIPVGAILLAGGSILLLNTLFGVSLAWIADWWPVAPMAFGAWLLYKGYQEKREALA